MKNKLIILLLFTGSLQANAQKADYHKLIDTGKVWYTVVIAEFGEIEAWNITTNFEVEYNANDTIYYSIGPSPGNTFIIVREDTITKKVYSRGFDDYNIPNGSEKLIYDFSLEEGDSIYFQNATNICSGTGWFYIDSIRIKSYFETEKNVFYLNNHHPNTPTVTWIEGIGSTAGVQYFNAYPMVIDWDCGELTCCYHYDDLLYQSANGAQWGCSFENVDIKKEIDIKLYPNPANDYFFINYNLKEIQAEDIFVQITDSKGVVIKEIELDKNTNQSKISTSSWAKGVYFVNITANDKVIESLKIVIK